MTSDPNELFMGGGSLDWDSERPMTVGDFAKLALEWRAEAERLRAEIEQEVKRRYAPILTENKDLRDDVERLREALRQAGDDLDRASKAIDERQAEIEGWKRAHYEMTAARDAMESALAQVSEAAQELDYWKDEALRLQESVIADAREIEQLRQELDQERSSNG